MSRGRSPVSVHLQKVYRKTYTNATRTWVSYQEIWQRIPAALLGAEATHQKKSHLSMKNLAWLCFLDDPTYCKEEASTGQIPKSIQLPYSRSKYVVTLLHTATLSHISGSSLMNQWGSGQARLSSFWLLHQLALSSACSVPSPSSCLLLTLYSPLFQNFFPLYLAGCSLIRSSCF